MNQKFKDFIDEKHPAKVYGREVLRKTLEYQKKYNFKVGNNIKSRKERKMFSRMN